MKKGMHADYVYEFNENDVIRPSSSKSWSTLFNTAALGYDLGGGEIGGISPTPDTLLPTQTTRQSNYDEAIRLSKSPSLSIINPIARSANIQLEEIHVHKGPSPIPSPRLSATKTKSYNGVADSSKEKGVKDDKSTKEHQTMTDIKYKKLPYGVISKDPKLNKDPKKLYNFFKSNNGKPEMVIRIHGYRTEEDETSQVVDGSNGYEYKKDVYTIEISDFDFNIDLTDHILPQGDIYPIPKDDDDYDIKDVKDTMQVLEEYCKTSSGFKEIEMRKVIIWDYESLTKAIATIIRQQNYYNNIRISYPLRDNLVKVQSPSTLYNSARNKWIQIICLLTCLWIIFWPVWWLYRKVYSVQLKSEFRMKINTKEWFENNVSRIISMVKAKG